MWRPMAHYPLEYPGWLLKYAPAAVLCKAAKLVDLSYLVTNDTGLIALPNDPIGGVGAYSTGFAVVKQSDGSVVFSAPRAEDGADLTLKLK